MSTNFEEVEEVRGDESTTTNADAEEVERASKRQRQAENALAESAADDAEQNSPAPTPDEVGFVPGSLRFDGANVESYPMPDEIKRLHVSQFGMFVNAVNRDCVQLNCVIRDPIKGSGSKSLTMHVIKFKTAPGVIPCAVAELAEKTLQNNIFRRSWSVSRYQLILVKVCSFDNCLVKNTPWIIHSS